MPFPIILAAVGVGSAIVLDEKLKTWLYDEPWTRQKYDTYQKLNLIPGVSNYMDYLLDVRADNEYLARYGMDYTNIHDPRKLRQTSSYGSVVNFVSHNVTRLYG